MRSAAKVVAGASAVVFCASGFAQNLSPIERWVLLASDQCFLVVVGVVVVVIAVVVVGEVCEIFWQHGTTFDAFRSLCQKKFVEGGVHDDKFVGN